MTQGIIRPVVAPSWTGSPDNQTADLFGPTPSQTVGPFFHYGLPWKGGADLTGQSELGARLDLFPAEHDVLNQSPLRGAVMGQPIEIIGQVRDGEGAPVPDVLIETWQANAAGRYHSPDDQDESRPLDPHFIGFGRSATSATGHYRFRTIFPGRVRGPTGADQAPHISVGVVGRGLLKRLTTRLYFADGRGNDTDAVLSLVPETRRETIIAAVAGEDPKTYRFDIVLQGTDETVFFTF